MRCPSYENESADHLGPTPSSLHSARASPAPGAHALLLTDNRQSALTGGVLLIGRLGVTHSVWVIMISMIRLVVIKLLNDNRAQTLYMA